MACHFVTGPTARSRYWGFERNGRDEVDQLMSSLIGTDCSVHVQPLAAMALAWST